ncbi:MAG TPA: bifunctional riboflavin kinase/FAD synthetase [Candidatus Acidoferrales bacterium]|jgi:riboflavin kinase/FMN adenylyltransferase|nr:bifunctional riboflavin kinase/FAD synthetase [Candidatus Acidoferrales bacterium]
MALVRMNSAQEWMERFGAARRPSVLTIGNFDGMHRGHQEILKRVVLDARRKECMAAVLTFFPHPVRVLRPTDAPMLLNTLDQRLAAFEAAGIEAALVLRFDEALSKMGAEEFVEKYLAETMRAREVLVGENFRFGHKQQGDMATLRALGKRFGFEVEIVGSLQVDDSVVSSTAVRTTVSEGRMEDAAHLLGRPFTLSGQVQRGTGQGRKLVVPTLNLKTEQELLPKRGVYVTRTIVGGESFPSVTNVGMRPTFNGAHVTVESNLFGFDLEVTSGEMEVQFLARLRDEQKFSGVEALREQVLRDIEKAKEFHREHATG